MSYFYYRIESPKKVWKAFNNIRAVIDKEVLSEYDKFDFGEEPKSNVRAEDIINTIEKNIKYIQDIINYYHYLDKYCLFQSKSTNRDYKPISIPSLEPVKASSLKAVTDHELIEMNKKLTALRNGIENYTNEINKLTEAGRKEGILDETKEIRTKKSERKKIYTEIDNLKNENTYKVFSKYAQLHANSSQESPLISFSKNERYVKRVVKKYGGIIFKINTNSERFFKNDSSTAKEEEHLILCALTFEECIEITIINGKAITLKGNNLPRNIPHA